MNTVRAKFEINSVTNIIGGQRIEGQAVYGHTDENKDFTDATPYGTLYLEVNGQVPARDHFSPGDQVYVDFSKDPPQQAALFDVFRVNKLVDDGGSVEVYLECKPSPAKTEDPHRCFSESKVMPSHKIMIQVWKEFPAHTFFNAGDQVFASFTKLDQ